MLLIRARHAALVAALACATVGAPRRACAADPPPRACFDAAEQGQALRDQAKLRAARDAFRICAAATCPSLVQRDCAGWLQDVENRIPSLIVTASDARGNELIDVSVSVDGRPFATKLDGVSQPVDPGVHVFHFEAKDAEPLDQQLVIRDGEKYQKLSVVLKAHAAPPSAYPVEMPSHGSGYKTAAIISAGVGVVALGAFTYFGIKGVSDDTHDEHTCAPRCGSEADSVRNELRFADVALGVTVVAAALTAFFYIEYRSHNHQTTTAAATLVQPQPPFSFTGTGFRF